MILPKTKIEIKPDVFSKAEGDKLHILTFSSESLVTLDEQGKEIWLVLQENGEIPFSELIELFRNDYEGFGENEQEWVAEFLSELHTLGLISIN